MTLRTLLFLFLTKANFLLSAQDFRGQYDVVRGVEMLPELWPKEVTFTYSNRNIPDKEVTARFGHYNKGYFYFYCDYDCYIFQTNAVRNLFGETLQAHVDNMPIIHRAVNYRYIQENPEIIPDKVNVLVPYKNSRHYYNEVADRGIDPDIIKGLSRMKKGETIYISEIDKEYVSGYTINKKGRKKEVIYYGPFTNLLEAARLKFRKDIEEELQRFSDTVSYEEVFVNQGHGISYEQIEIDVIHNQFDLLKFIYHQGGERRTNGLTLLVNHPFDHMKVYPESPINQEKNTQKESDADYAGLMYKKNFALIKYQYPLDGEFEVNKSGQKINDSTYRFSFDLANNWNKGITTEFYPTEKHLLLKLPGNGTISELSSTGNIKRKGNSMYVFKPAGLDSLKLDFLYTQFTSRPESEQKVGEDTELDKVQTFENVVFYRTTARIKPQSFKELKEVITLLNTNPTWTIELRGHTDNISPDKALNKKLSEERVAAIKQYLVKEGNIEEERIFGKGYGAEDLIVEDRSDKEQYAKNRRVEFIFHEQK